MKVRLSDFNPEWKMLFESECRLLSDILKDEVINFEHFGSTAVPNMKTKPVIDMMILVKDISKIDRYNPQFINSGYDIAGEWGIPGRRLLRKGGENRTHHIHIYQYDHPEIHRHLAVRDYLLLNAEEVKFYSALKEKLSKQYDETREYSKAKKSYVAALEIRALQYFNDLDQEIQ